jgi:hypothetical protein
VTADAVEYDRDRLSWQIIRHHPEWQRHAFADTRQHPAQGLQHLHDASADARQGQTQPGPGGSGEAANFRKNPAWSDIQKLDSPTNTRTSRPTWRRPP